MAKTQRFSDTSESNHCEPFADQEKRHFVQSMPLCVFLITIFALLPSLQNGFLEWDEKLLVNNPNYRGMAWSQIRWMLTDVQTASYQPVSWITFSLDYLLWGIDPFGYHLTSLILHAIAATVLYFVTLRLLPWEQLSSISANGMPSKISAGFSALVFAIHPLRVEPVALASARSDPLCGVFFLISIFCYLKAHDMAAERWKSWWMTGCILTFGLSILSNFKGIALPFVLLLLDAYPLKKLEFQAGGWLNTEGRHLLQQKILFLVFAMGIILLPIFAGPHVDSVATGSSVSVGVSPSLAYVLIAPAFYLSKTVIPAGLSPFYEFTVWYIVLAVAALAAISSTLFFLRARLPAVWTIWACYLVLLLPGAAADGTGLPLISDRNCYLAGIPVAVLAGSALFAGQKFIVKNKLGLWASIVPSGLAVSALILFGTITWSLTQAWHDTERLWRSAAAAGDSSAAHFKVAAILEYQEKDQEAIEHYKKTAEMDLTRWDAHEKAGLLLHKQNRVQEAASHLRRALAISPNRVEARDALATALVTMGEVGEATQHFRKVLELSPDLNDARLKLATIFALQGNLQQAVSLYEQALEREPDDAKIHSKLGEALAAQGRLESAVQAFRKALQLRPNDPEFHENLGRALAELGKSDEAAAHLREALRILRSTPAAR
jgi:tetratricopeptide (TPR) repeat protein